MFKNGCWEIKIDEEKTKKYYASLPTQNTQGNRNFRENIMHLTVEEKAFFESLCIDLSKLDVSGFLFVSTYLHKKRHWGCNSDIYVFGEIISAPTIPIITIEDVSENGLEILEGRETGEIKVGRFEFEIQNPDEWEPNEECPEGAIYISMDYAELDWLLDEKCEEIITEGTSIFTMIKTNLHDLFLGKLEEKRENRKRCEITIEYFKKLGINLTPLSHKQMLEYKKEWVGNYTDDPEIIKNALPSRKMHNLLWHVFSFEDNKAIEGDEATTKYDNITKSKAVIYIDDIDTAFQANDVSKLTSFEIEELNSNEELEFGCIDIIITADDFSWTYCRTHESGWIGPYFYQKK